MQHYDFSVLPDPLPRGWENNTQPNVRAYTATQVTEIVGLDPTRRADVTAIGIALTRLNQDRQGRPRRLERRKLRLWAMPPLLSAAGLPPAARAEQCYVPPPQRKPGSKPAEREGRPVSTAAIDRGGDLGPPCALGPPLKSQRSQEFGGPAPPT